MEDKTTRREFIRDLARGAGALTLAGGFGALVSSCAPKKENSDPENLYNVLKQHYYVNQDGEVLDVNELQSALNGKMTTVSFGFSKCTQYCPYINGALGALHKDKPEGLTSIVIGTQPQEDGATPEARASFKESLKSMIGLNEPQKMIGGKAPKNGKYDDKVIILYPCELNAQTGQLEYSDKIVPKVEEAFGNIANQSDPKQHTANIALYTPDGALIKKKLASLETPPDDFVKEWETSLKSYETKQKSSGKSGRGQ